MLNLIQHLTASLFLTIFRGQIPKRVRDDMACVYNLLVMLNLFQHLTASHFLTIFRGQIPKRVRDDMACAYNLLVMLNLFQHLTVSLFLTFSADRSRNEFGMTWRVSIAFLSC